MHQNAPRKLRKYLIDMQDDAAIIALDKMNMASGARS